MIPIDVLIFDICKYLGPHDILSVISSCKLYFENSYSQLDVFLSKILLSENLNLYFSDIYDTKIYSILIFNNNVIDDLPRIESPINALTRFSLKQPFKYRNKYYYIPESCLIERSHLIAKYIGYSFYKIPQFILNHNEKYLFINMGYGPYIKYDVFLSEAFEAINQYLSSNGEITEEYLSLDDIIKDNSHNKTSSENIINSNKSLKRIYFLLYNETQSYNVKLLKTLIANKFISKIN